MRPVFFQRRRDHVALLIRVGGYSKTGNRFSGGKNGAPRAAPSRIAACNLDVNNGFEARNNPERARELIQFNRLESRPDTTTRELLARL